MQSSRYEVMLLATSPAHRIRKGIWYLESEHEDVAQARIRYGAFVAEHPDPRLVVVMVESRYSEADGMFVDRILASRAEGPAPALRASVALPDEARRSLRETFGRPPVPGLSARRRAKPAIAKRRPSAFRALVPWLVAAAIAGACGGAVLAFGG